MALSSNKAEYKSLVLITIKVSWILSLLTKLIVSHKLPIIHCDNTSTVSLTHNPVLHARTKHMELDLFFVRENILNKLLLVIYVLATGQYVEIITKSLSLTNFEAFRFKLTLCDPSNSCQSHPLMAPHCSYFLCIYVLRKFSMGGFITGKRTKLSSI